VKRRVEGGRSPKKVSGSPGEEKKKIMKNDIPQGKGKSQKRAEKKGRRDERMHQVRKRGGRPGRVS